MKLCPERVLGGSSPVVACFKHSMIVCTSTHAQYISFHKASCFWCQCTFSPQVEQAMQAEAHRFASSVVPDNKCQGLVEFNDMSIFWAKAPNALDEHLQCAVI